MHSDRRMIDGPQIKAARARIGESQKSFAKRLGGDQATLSRWESFGTPARGPAEAIVERVLVEVSEGEKGFQFALIFRDLPELNGGVRSRLARARTPVSAATERASIGQSRVQ